MADHVQWHAALTVSEERVGGGFSDIKLLTDFFSNEAPNVVNSKVLNTKYMTVVVSYVW